MVSNKVARRYAKSLLFLAQERKELDAIKGEMEAIRNIISENRDLRVFLNSPVIKKDKKVDILNQVFSSNMGELVKGFINIITKNNRENLLHEIAIGFVELYNDLNKVITGTVTSAVELDEDTKAKIREIISVMDHNDIQLSSKVDPEIIGGVVLRVGDAQIDASVARQLREIENELITTDYEVKL